MLSFILSPLGKGLTILAVIAAAYLGFRLWIAEHDRNVLSGYVLAVEKTALEAQLDLERANRLKADQLRTEAEKRASAAAKVASDARIRLEALIASDTEDGGATWTDKDIIWLRDIHGDR